MIGRRSTPVFVLLGSLAWLVASCRQLAGVEERSRCEGLSVSAGSCDACLAGSCCTETLACRSDAECSQLRTCLAACAKGEEHCKSDCRQKNPLGSRTPAFASLTACTATHCNPACTATCGGYLYPDTECATCVTAECCDLAAKCAANAECVALAYCQDPCAGSDPACNGACQRRYPAGRDDARAFAECVRKSCDLACGYDSFTPDWSCVDKDPEIPSTGPPVTLSLQVAAVEIGGAWEPVEGATVRACNVEDDLCEPHVATGTTDTDGWASLGLPHGFDGYYWIQASGLLDEIAYVDPPVVASGNRDESQLTPSALAYALMVSGTLDPDLGLIYLRAMDCNHANASSMSFQIAKVGGGPINSGAVLYYGVAGVPESDWSGGTPSSGEGGFMNLEPGAYEVTVLRRETRTCVAKKQLFVRANSVTFWGAVARKCE